MPFAKHPLHWTIILAAALGGAVDLSATANGDSKLPPPILPQPQFQSQIQRVHKAFLTQKPSVSYRELDALSDLEPKNPVILVEQIALFVSTLVDGEEALFFLIAIEHLELDDLTIVSGLADHINSENRMLRSFAHDNLRRIEKANAWGTYGTPSLRSRGVYAKYIRSRVNRSLPVPEPFVEYLYRRAPGHVLIAFLKAHEQSALDQKSVLWAEHVIADAIWKKKNNFETLFLQGMPRAVSELEKLSTQETWWVRLYVAEIMRQNLVFRRPEIIERLKQDEHPLVRKTMRFTEKKANKGKQIPFVKAVQPNEEEAAKQFSSP